MKKIITSLCLSFMFAVMAMAPSKANVYYVLDGQEFNLIPQIGSSVFSQILWTVDGVAQSPITDNIGKFTKTFTLGAGAAKLVPVEHIIKLGVVADALGCVSDILEHTVVVLPKVTLSIASPAGSTFCEGLVTGQLTVSADVDLPALKSKYNVTLTPFGWTGDGTGTGNTLTISKAGSYSVSADYLILTAGDAIVGALVPTATKIIGTGAVATATKVITTVAKPIVPALTFN